MSTKYYVGSKQVSQRQYKEARSRGVATTVTTTKPSTVSSSKSSSSSKKSTISNWDELSPEAKESLSSQGYGPRTSASLVTQQAAGVADKQVTTVYTMTPKAGGPTTKVVITPEDRAKKAVASFKTDQPVSSVQAFTTQTFEGERVATPTQATKQIEKEKYPFRSKYTQPVEEKFTKVEEFAYGKDPLGLGRGLAGLSGIGRGIYGLGRSIIYPEETAKGLKILVTDPKRVTSSIGERLQGPQGEVALGEFIGAAIAAKGISKIAGKATSGITKARAKVGASKIAKQQIRGVQEQVVRPQDSYWIGTSKLKAQVSGNVGKYQVKGAIAGKSPFIVSKKGEIISRPVTAGKAVITGGRKTIKVSSQTYEPIQIGLAKGTKLKYFSPKLEITSVGKQVSVSSGYTYSGGLLKKGQFLSTDITSLGKVSQTSKLVTGKPTTLQFKGWSASKPQQIALLKTKETIKYSSDPYLYSASEIKGFSQIKVTPSIVSKITPKIKLPKTITPQTPTVTPKTIIPTIKPSKIIPKVTKVTKKPTISFTAPGTTGGVRVFSPTTTTVAPTISPTFSTGVTAFKSSIESGLFSAMSSNIPSLPAGFASGLGTTLAITSTQARTPVSLNIQKPKELEIQRPKTREAEIITTIPAEDTASETISLTRSASLQLLATDTPTIPQTVTPTPAPTITPSLTTITPFPLVPILPVFTSTIKRKKKTKKGKPTEKSVIRYTPTIAGIFSGRTIKVAPDKRKIFTGTELRLPVARSKI